jgi:sigma-B regulation protein RsbU (phosphoserine phosphatase)
MRDDLLLAREVQQAFLPSRCPTFPIGSVSPSLQFVQRYVPAGAVGGDYFDVFALSQELAAIVMCDVMGHGVRAALVTAMLRAMVGPQAASAHEPAAMLTDLNQRLRQILKSDESVMFVTCVYLLVNAVTGEVRSANAGHPKPLTITFDGTVSQMSTAAVGPPLGLVENPKYQTQEHLLKATDRLFLFTDGVYEVAGADGESFGQTRLQQTLSSLASLSANAFLDALLEKVKAHSLNGAFEDDACLLTIDFRRPTDSS